MEAGIGAGGVYFKDRAGNEVKVSRPEISGARSRKGVMK